MTRGGEHGVADQHPGVARLPAARPAGRARRPADVRRQRRQGAGPGRGLAGRGGRGAPTTSPWSCRPASAAASCSTAGCSTARDGNAGHIGHVIVEPDGRPVPVREPGLPRGRGVGHRPSPPSPAGPPAEAGAARSSSAPARSSAGRWPRWPTCSTCAWRWWPARWPSASASRSSPPPRPRSTRRARLDFSAGARHPPGRPRRPTARWSAPPPSAGRLRWRSATGVPRRPTT